MVYFLIGLRYRLLDIEVGYFVRVSNLLAEWGDFFRVWYCTRDLMFIDWIYRLFDCFDFMFIRFPLIQILDGLIRPIVMFLKIKIGSLPFGFSVRKAINFLLWLFGYDFYFMRVDSRQFTIFFLFNILNIFIPEFENLFVGFLPEEIGLWCLLLLFVFIYGALLVLNFKIVVFRHIGLIQILLCFIVLFGFILLDLLEVMVIFGDSQDVYEDYYKEYAHQYQIYS